MKVIRLMLDGKSQFLRSSGPFRMACHWVKATRDGNGSLCVPVDDPWWMMEAGLAAFEPGFRMTRKDGIAEGIPDSTIKSA